jgi:SAM-dependent methyltransferase
MTKLWDAYGRAVLDYLEKGQGFEIIEREDGFISPSGGPPNYFAEYADWPEHQQRAMAFVKGRALDIGCGAGRVSLHLQEGGRLVTAIDNSPMAIEVCKRRGVNDARVIPITRISSQLGSFKTILMLGNNFGLLANPVRARWLLRRFHSLTTPKARIIAESNDIYQTDDPDHLAYHQRNLTRNRMAGQIRLRVRYRHYTSPWFDYLMVSPSEMAGILEGTGWRISRILESGASPYIAVIKKTQS